MKYKFNLYRLKKKLELQTGEEISWSEMARKADLHRNTLERIATNSATRLDMETLGKLIAFFEAAGMPITPTDLLVPAGDSDAPTAEAPR